MKVTFKTSNLKVESIDGGNWRLLEPLVAEISDDGVTRIVVVPAGFVTDFESVPRLLVFAYALIKGKARMSATVHDYLLDVIHGKLPNQTTPTTILLGMTPDRKWIDSVFYAAMQAEGTPWYAREMAYMGVSAYSLISN